MTIFVNNYVLLVFISFLAFKYSLEANIIDYILTLPRSLTVRAFILIEVPKLF